MRALTNRKCASCSVTKPIVEFSKNQRSKGERGRCKGCVSSAMATPSSATATPTTTKENKKRTASVTPGPPTAIKQVKIVCTKCLGGKKNNEFPKDEATNGPSPPTRTCTACIIDEISLPCSACGDVSKSVEDFSFIQLGLLRLVIQKRYAGGNTTAQVKKMALDLSSENKLECLDCATIRKAKEKRQDELHRQEMMAKHNIQLYDYYHSVPDKEYSKTQPPDTGPLAGEYDIVFHSGVCTVEDVENRTTKGTVVLKEDDSADGTVVSGVVEFHPELRLSQTLCFQRDFRLSQGSHGIFKDTCNQQECWECSLKAKLVDKEAADVVHYCDQARASLRRIAKRVALPWMKKEWPEDNDDEPSAFEKVALTSLQHAEELAAQHETTGPDDAASSKSKPKPVLFLEPGDLILHTEWSDDHREEVVTNCVLRKRQAT